MKLGDNIQLPYLYFICDFVVRVTAEVVIYGPQAVLEQAARQTARHGVIGVVGENTGSTSVGVRADSCK